MDTNFSNLRGEQVDWKVREKHERFAAYWAYGIRLKFAWNSLEIRWVLAKNSLRTRLELDENSLKSRWELTGNSLRIFKSFGSKVNRWEFLNEKTFLENLKYEKFKKLKEKISQLKAEEELVRNSNLNIPTRNLWRARES